MGKVIVIILLSIGAVLSIGTLILMKVADYLYCKKDKEIEQDSLKLDCYNVWQDFILNNINPKINSNLLYIYWDKEAFEKAFQKYICGPDCGIGFEMYLECRYFPKLLEEMRINKKKMKLNDICVMRYNTINKNGRMYRMGSVNLNEPILKSRLKSGTLYGELGMPQDSRRSVDLSKVAFVVTSLYEKEDGLYANIEILDTPNGRILKAFDDKAKELGVKCIGGFATRGTGDLIPAKTIDGKEYLQVENYNLDNIDWVEYPA